MKTRLTYLVALIGYYLGIDSVFYYLNRRCKRVLTFHNVFPDELCARDDAGGMSESVSSFKAIVGELSRRFRFSTDFEDPNTLTMTFDDGFRCQYEVAAKVLRDNGIPAVLFVSGDNVDRKKWLDAPAVDLLTVWLANVPVGTKCFDRVVAASNRHRIWVEVLRPKYAADCAHLGRSVVEACNREYSFEKIFLHLSPEYLSLRLEGVSREQLEDLRGQGWKIGWHSRSHYPLASVQEELKAGEIVPPPEFRYVPMSYPYGEMRSVSERDIEIASQSGCPAAYSNLPEINPRIGLFFLPRFTVPSNKILLHFHLSGFRHFVKFRRLLPPASAAQLLN